MAVAAGVWAAHPPAAVWPGLLLGELPRQPRFPFRSQETIERTQRRRVAATIRYAYAHVPHYRAVMDRLGIAPAQIRSAGDLARLPLIERAELQRNPAVFTSRARPLRRFVPLQTGGSSGAPVTVYHEPFGLVRAVALHQRATALHRKVVGRAWGCRTLAIAHASEGRLRRIDQTMAWVTGLAGYRVQGTSVLDPVERGIEAINRFRPDVLRGFGSYLEALFLHLHETGEPSHRPRVAVYGGDAMSDRARRLITDTFGIPVLSTYGAFEARHLGFECTAHRGYHVNVDFYPLRIVDPDGRDVPAGEMGEVVVSNLLNRGTVLLNYRLGDLAAWVPGPCPCGRTLPLLSFVHGRVADWISTPSGTRFHPQTLTVVLDVDPDVLRYQVVQSSPAGLAVKIIVRADSDRAGVRRRIQRGLSQLFAGQLTVHVDFVDDLARTGRGKVRTVIGLSG